jgi:hypothetical protein
MFIIPTSDVLLLGTAITIVLAALQRFIGGVWFHNFRVQRPESGSRSVRFDFDRAA